MRQYSRTILASLYEMLFGHLARMLIEVKLNVPLRNPSYQSDYNQLLGKALSYSIKLVQCNLALARS